MCKTCDICNSNSYVQKYKNTNMKLCSRCRNQMARYGIVKDRTKIDSNIIEIDKKDSNRIIMHLYNKNSEEVGMTYFDAKHIDIVKEFKWCLGERGHVVARVGKSTIRLHRFLTKAKTHEIVKHIDGNPLNNMDNNLFKKEIVRN